jgi:uncharacterized membrane protein YfbV (UPF0208 family)
MLDSKWPEAFGVAAVAAAFALVLTPWEKIGPIDWNALSAVGTIAAAAIALGIALRDGFRQKHERERSVKLIATGVLVYFNDLSTEVTTAVKTLREARKHPEQYGNFLKTVSESFAKLDLSFLSQSELSALEFLPNNGGEKAYAGLACLRAVKSAFERRLETALDSDQQGQLVLLNHWLNHIEIGGNFILESMRDLSRYSSVRLIQAA